MKVSFTKTSWIVVFYIMLCRANIWVHISSFVDQCLGQGSCASSFLVKNNSFEFSWHKSWLQILPQMFQHWQLYIICTLSAWHVHTSHMQYTQFYSFLGIISHIFRLFSLIMSVHVTLFWHNTEDIYSCWYMRGIKFSIPVLPPLLISYIQFVKLLCTFMHS